MQSAGAENQHNLFVGHRCNCQSALAGGFSLRDAVSPLTDDKDSGADEENVSGDELILRRKVN